MKILVPALLLLAACSGSEPYPKAENDLDAAREFVRASLDGDADRAYFYLLKDSTNQFMWETQKRNYSNMSPDTKARYKESSIRAIELKPINDTVSTFRYYHSANPTDTSELRIIKTGGTWLIDLKSLIKM